MSLGVLRNWLCSKTNGAVSSSTFLNKYADATVGADGNPPGMRDDCHRPLRMSHKYSVYASRETAPR